jgi:hypothetical protein
MTLAEHILARLKSFGLSATIDIDTRRERKALLVDVKGETKRIRIDPDWEEAYVAYARARSRDFDIEDLSFTLNNSISFPLVRLDVEGIRETSDKFADTAGNTVEVSRASIQYSLAHFDSLAYENFFEQLVRGRLERANPQLGRPLSILFRSPIIATYTAKGKKTPANFKNVAIEKIQACLVKMAVERHSCYEFWKLRPRKYAGSLGESSETDSSIPDVSYEKNVTNFYMVARSSPFPSQSFLAYYHVLEYYFLKVSEDALHHQLRALINKTNFKSNTDGIDKLISLE